MYRPTIFKYVLCFFFTYKQIHNSTFTFGEDVLDQQVGCLWQGDTLVSLSLSGDLNYLDINNPGKPLRVIKVRIVLFFSFIIHSSMMVLLTMLILI